MLAKIHCAVIAGLVTFAAAASAEDNSATLTLKELQPNDAVILLHTIAGCKDVVVVDEHSVRVEDTAQNIALAEQVVALVDGPPDPSPTTVTAEDGSVVLVVSLQNAAPMDVMRALRTDVKIAHVAIHQPSRILVRDTEDQVAAAIELIRKLDTRAN